MAMDRTVWRRGSEIPESEGDETLENIEIEDLGVIFSTLMAHVPESTPGHDKIRERITIRESIASLLEVLDVVKVVTFRKLFSLSQHTREFPVLSFVAILELARLEQFRFIRTRRTLTYTS
jgi:chromatin segregation and condensation protein Rec8/ScpA/Scc1 (kleisin family)